ncbi:MAG: prephenate dehydrogenase [Anaerolineae bacterium]|nr:prephenate dehydrogenase [Anaerolineae bacterium]
MTNRKSQMTNRESQSEWADVRVDSLSEATVAVVGLGLMGGSLAGALHGRCKMIIGIARRKETALKAMELGLIDRATADLTAGVREADIAVLATPVRTILQQIPQIGPLLSPGCLLTDLGSTKADIVEAMAGLPPHVQPLGGHPMCGKESSGIEAADVTLYRGRTYILSPLERTSEKALSLGQALACAVGANPLVVDAARQDFLVATLSHLPYMLACALVATADATTSADPLAWQIVASGFRDTSRVAGSDVTMMLDILLTNQGEVVNAMTQCLTQMKRLAQLVAEGDEAKLRQILGKIRNTRQEMFP